MKIGAVAVTGHDKGNIYFIRGFEHLYVDGLFALIHQFVAIWAL